MGSAKASRHTRFGRSGRHNNKRFLEGMHSCAQRTETKWHCGALQILPNHAGDPRGSKFPFRCIRALHQGAVRGVMGPQNSSAHSGSAACPTPAHTSPRTTRRPLSYDISTTPKRLCLRLPKKVRAAEKDERQGPPCVHSLRSPSRISRMTPGIGSSRGDIRILVSTPLLILYTFLLSVSPYLSH